mgnify:CR=1 FL=1
MDAGLASLPGTAAEILDDEIRKDLCPDKINTEEWLEVHRTAHNVGLRSNITMMFGSIEHPKHWVKHLLLCRALQKETGGFTEFVGFSDLKLLIANNQISERAAIITSYALCGFANFGSIGIQLGGIGGIAPDRRKDIAQLIFKAMIGGALASWLTATLAGILI